MKDGNGIQNSLKKMKLTQIILIFQSLIMKLKQKQRQFLIKNTILEKILPINNLI